MKTLTHITINNKTYTVVSRIHTLYLTVDQSGNHKIIHISEVKR
jgi:hypothetical protein